VLDRNVQPAPTGVPGELFIAGAGVSRGYLGRPELTAERFLPDPFATDLTGGRMYRTGDRVRWLPDGTLEFLGRVDFQVKVRGFRIELGEIEETLRRHGDIREAVVLAPEGEGGARRLLAYVVPQDAARAPTAAALRQHLLATLPEYMVPSAFLALDAMPLTPNGKIDRKALLRIKPEEAARVESGLSYVAPVGPVESALAEIYAKVLGVPQVGANDNFFELGGDSILTIQVVARAGQAGIRITPKQLFQASTVAGLALLAEIAPAGATTAEQGLVEGELPLTPIQRVFFDSGFAKPNHWNQSLLLSVRGRLDPNALHAATRAVLRHHDALRLRFERAEGGWRQINAAMPDETPFQLVDLSGLTPAARSEALRERTLAAQQSLNISEGPLVRVVYFDYGPSEHGRVLTVVHHLAVDRVSWRILLEDLGTAYEQVAQGKAASFPAKTTPFRKWAHRLKTFSQSPALAEEAAYWLRLERSQPAPLTLDRASGSNTEADARTAAVYLDEGETESLLRDAGQAYGMDAREILLAALAQACEKWTGTPQLFVQVEGHGRQGEIVARGGQDTEPPVDLSRTVGWFTALYPALFELKPGWGPRETLLAVKEQARSTPSGGLGFGLLRYLSGDKGIARRMARLPEPEISFNYLGQFVQDASESSPFGPAPESSGPDHAAVNRRQSLLDVTASVFGGRLRAEFTYSDAQFAAETAEMLADLFIESLRTLIQHCLSPEAGGYSASDFADAGLDEEGVQDLLLELGEIDD
jgi:non-ribosomal peptide synthase protein (TIGR01720 family)